MIMKKLNQLLAFFLLAFVVVSYTSCTDDAGAEKPTVTVTEAAGATYTPGSDVVYTVTASTNDELSTLTVTGEPVNPNFSYTYEKGLSTNSQDLTFTIPTTLAAGSVQKLTFTVTTDKDGETAIEKAFTVVANVPAMNTYTGLSSIGSYTSLDKVSAFDAETGTAVAPKGTEDIVLLYNGTVKNMVLSPNSAQAKSLYAVNSVTYNSTTATKLQLLSGVNYDNVDAAYLDALTVTPDADGYMTVAVNDVVAFQTATGKKGVLKVTAVTYTKADAPISYSVKVQATVATAK